MKFKINNLTWTIKEVSSDDDMLCEFIGLYGEQIEKITQSYFKGVIS